jgi:hypothetical protein
MNAPVAPTLVIPLRAKAGMSLPDFYQYWLNAHVTVPAAALRRFVTETLEPAYAGSPEILKLRRHLFEPLEATLDHPGVVLSKPPELQYQAALEVVVADESALARFAASPAFTGTADGLAAHCEGVHAARVDRCIATKDRGAITLAGVRGVAVADLIRRLGADSQREAAVSALFLPELAGSP